MIEARDLGVERAGRVLLKALSFSAGPGEALLVRGANGCGKSSLLRVIAGLLPPAGGALFWNRRPLNARTRGATCLYLGHDSGFRPELTARENLELAASLDGAPCPDPDLVLARVGLAARRHAPFGRLSAGQRRRVALARMTISLRPLWILDEPATSIDAEGVSLLGEILRRGLDAGNTIIVATHDALDIPESAVRPLAL